MRFDDSLDTVLAAESIGQTGIGSAWRQLVDLIGRRRGDDYAAAIARLRAIRDEVPVSVRAASARGLERADPPAELVALFADDVADVAAPVVRTARLDAAAWTALLPRMRPATRGVLRHRRDLDAAVTRALASFGPADLALPPSEAPAAIEPAVSGPLSVSPPEAAGSPAFAAPDPDPFVPLGDVARELPLVAVARRQPRVPATAATAAGSGDDFAIAELVARIEARQADPGAHARPLAPPAPAPTAFRFETDATGAIRWCDHPARGPLIGREFGGTEGDGAVRGAFAKRTAIRDARFAVPGESEAAGDWRISALPAFDRASGRFTGYRGTARRPRRDEAPELAQPEASGGDSLRQLVHELRTPANAISGFAEMIEREVLGPVPPAYRDQAAAIRLQTGGLLETIDDLDIAARIETRRLELRPATVAVVPLLEGVMADLQPLADLRGAFVTLDLADGLAVCGDERALRRLFSRLLTALVATAVQGEVLDGTIERDADAIRFDVARPRGFTASDGTPFDGDAEVEQAAAGAPLLGTGFAFRLARGLAGELGGGIVITPERLTLRLPAADQAGMEQATV